MGLLDWLGGGERTVQEALMAAGVGEDEILAARAAGVLELLAIERLVITHENRYTVEDVAAEVDLDPELLGHLWRALGFPDPPADEPAFTDFDVATIHDTADLVAGGVADLELVLQMTRVIGSSLSRVAAAQVGSLLDQRRALAAGREGLGTEETFEERAGLLLERMPRIMDYVWRRHLEVEARRRLIEVVGGSGGRSRTVGFADLVGFTALAQQVPDEELAAIVDRFEAMAFDTVARFGGRVIKMIGDEVMFVVDDASTAVELGLEMADAYHGEEATSDVRVGLASGRVLEREGDLFGPTVNLASRIAGIAYPGAVVVSESIRDELGDEEGIEFHSLRTHTLKDIGRVPLWVVRRAGEQRSLLDEARIRRELGRAWIEEHFG